MSLALLGVHPHVHDPDGTPPAAPDPCLGSGDGPVPADHHGPARPAPDDRRRRRTVRGVPLGSRRRPLPELGRAVPGGIGRAADRRPGDPRRPGRRRLDPDRRERRRRAGGRRRRRSRRRRSRSPRSATPWRPRTRGVVSPARRSGRSSIGSSTSRACTAWRPRSMPPTCRRRGLLEDLGFEYEGTAVSAVRDGETWVDDVRYALTADARARVGRPAAAPPDRRPARRVDARQPAATCCTSPRTASQRRFVAPMPESFADALVPEGGRRGSGRAVVPCRSRPTARSPGS